METKAHQGRRAWLCLLNGCVFDVRTPLTPASQVCFPPAVLLCELIQMFPQASSLYICLYLDQVTIPLVHHISLYLGLVVEPAQFTVLEVMLAAPVLYSFVMMDFIPHQHFFPPSSIHQILAGCCAASRICFVLKPDPEGWCFLPPSRVLST